MREVMTLSRTGSVFAATIVALALAFYAAPAFAQTVGVPEWTASMGGTLEDEGASIAVGPGGNIVITGSFQGSADFDPGIGTRILTSRGHIDSYVVKLNPDGTLLWAVSIGGSSDTIAKDVAIDSQGDIYVIGSFQGDTDFDPGPAEKRIASNGSTDIFLLRLDAKGNLVWAAGMGSDESDEGEAVYIDVRRHIYITGGFEEHMSVNFTLNSDDYWLTSRGNDDIFIVRYDNDGNVLRGWTMGGDDDAIGRDIVVDDAGYVYIAGDFEGKVDFAPGEDYQVRSAGHEDIFLVKYDDAGSMTWTATFGGRREEKNPAISMDSAGNIYMTGSFQSTADFDPGDGEYMLTSKGQLDIFLLKMNYAGGLLWVHTIGGVENDLGEGIVAGHNGDFFVTGTFEASVDFDPGLGATVLNGTVKEDTFLARYSSGGMFYSAQAMSGPQEENGHGVALDKSSAVYVVGGYENTVNFNVGADAQYRTSAGSRDIFVTKRLYKANPFGEPSVFLPILSADRHGG